MEVLYVMESLRRPWLNGVMSCFTELGGETVFLVLALVIFWCVDKRRGYYLMVVGFLGTLLNQFLKITFRIPRPWVLDSEFSIVESARAGAGGYSFPSGHSQNAVATYGAIALTTQRRWVKAVCFLICLLVPLSRMYLGVHTPLDVSVGAIMALLLLCWFRPLAMGNQPRQMTRLLGCLTILAVAFVAYTHHYPFPQDTDPENLSTAVTNSASLLGALLGVSLVYQVDNRWLHFPTQAPWYGQVGKVVIGLCLVLAIKEGVSIPLEHWMPHHSLRDTIQSFLLVVGAGVLWPMSFRYFSKLGSRHLKSHSL